MTKEDNEDCKRSTKCWISDNDYIDTDIKGRDYYHIIGKYRGSAQRKCNTNLNLINNIPVVFHNLKHYNSNLIMQELGKFNIKVSVTTSGLEKFMSFTIKLSLCLILVSYVLLAAFNF